MDLSKVDFKKLSLGQTLDMVSRYRLYEVKIKYLIVYQDRSSKEWIPYGLYDNFVIAEHFERLAKREFRLTSILPIEHYNLSVKV